jgi:hypothetical protein
MDFLFVVNELNIDQNRERFADIWGNNILPKNYMYYDPETIGLVFRFHTGTVTKELTYFWHRPSRVVVPGWPIDRIGHLRAPSADSPSIQGLLRSTSMHRKSPAPMSDTENLSRHDVGFDVGSVV